MMLRREFWVTDSRLSRSASGRGGIIGDRTGQAVPDHFFEILYAT